MLQVNYFLARGEGGRGQEKQNLVIIATDIYHHQKH